MKRRDIVVPLRPTSGCPQCTQRTRGRCTICMFELMLRANFGDDEAMAMVITGNQKETGEP